MNQGAATSVAIVLLPGFSMGALGVLMERFTLAGGAAPLIFSCCGEKMVAAEHGVQVQAQVLPPLPLTAHTLIVCGGRQSQPMPRETSEQLLRHARGATYRIGIGGGVLLMAQAGLLDGHRVSLAEGLRPQLQQTGRPVVPEGSPFTRDANLWTCSSEDGLPLMLDTLLPVWSGEGDDGGLQLQSEVEDRLTLAEAQALMRNNLAEPLATGEIAGYLGISSKKLERIFKRFVGQLPARFYIGLRLSLARDLLHHSSLSIEEIGKRCGFSSPSHFSRAFRNHFGCTPRTERQQFVSMWEPLAGWGAGNRACIAG
ncbi:GlxA family transcriptional regulator [Microbulbifer guangxiensis]|uniref:GlxA family transcriptional regulator n=1 Tax=Microbulbifer guangxiensis TaxID=2904249 RepID=UPI001F01B6BE|nr:helix-turn-helix domain-containing protein [Microbulbifer guangxiensis]